MGAQFDKLLPLLVNGGVEFILIGGVAGHVLGAARLTFDVDIVYNRSKANLEKIAETLRLQSPYLRGAPPGLLSRSTCRRSATDSTSRSQQSSAIWICSVKSRAAANK